MTSLPPRLRALEDALLALYDKADPMILSELDGFVAGLLVCPDLILPNEWLPLVWGGDEDNEPIFDDVADAQRLFGMVMQHYNQVAEDLQRGRYSPIYEADGLEDDVFWEMWLEGFETALQLRPDSWLKITREGDEDVAEALAGLVILAEIARGGSEISDEHVAELEQHAPELIPTWIAELHRWRLAQGGALDELRRSAPVRSPKVGRNDPCPCGSGKKYKKCCGLN